MMEEHFTEEEVWGMIKSLPPHKVSGPDEFTAHFFQVAWEIIRADLMRAFDAFWHLVLRSFYDINETLIVLLPKSDEAKAMRDYRPITLIHIIGKLFAKVLACQLAPRLGELVHPYQSAFIKGWSIQDSFHLVQSSTKLLHVRRRPSLLLKVDLAHAFDSVAWPFLIDVLWHMGFMQAW
jgi:hypothetical protein